MWNYSKSAIRYTWGKISDCHIVEVEPCTGTIGIVGTRAAFVTGLGLAGEGDLMVSGDQLWLQPGTCGHEVSKGRHPGPATEGT